MWALEASQAQRRRDRTPQCGERKFFIENILVRIHFIIEVIWWTGLAPREFEFPFPGSLISTFLYRLGCRSGPSAASSRSTHARLEALRESTLQSTTLSLKGNVPHASNCRALCAAHLVTQHPRIWVQGNFRTPPCGRVSGLEFGRRSTHVRLEAHPSNHPHGHPGPLSVHKSCVYIYTYMYIYVYNEHVYIYGEREIDR